MAVPERGRPLAMSALLVATLTGLSQLLGLFRDTVMAAIFGAGADVDAFLVAQGLLNLVLAVAAGAIAKATVPVLSRAVDTGRYADGLGTLRVALTLCTLVLGLAAVGMWFAADALVGVLAPGFDPAVRATAVELTRIMLVSVLFVAGTNILAGGAQAYGVFGWAALQGIPFNLAMIVAALALSPILGIRSLALGFAVGSFLRLLLQIPPMRRRGLRLRPSLRWRDPGLREMAVLVPPLLLGSALGNVNAVVDRAVASQVGTGAIAGLSYGYRLVSIFDMLVVATLATTLYPAFSAAGSPQRRAELRSRVDRGAGMALALLAPAVALLLVAGRPIVTLIYGRGDFDQAAVEVTALALAGYAVGLLALGVREVLTRASYAVGDSATPVRAALAGAIVNVVGDLTLGPAFGVIGIAVATTLSFVTAAVVLCWSAAHRHQLVRPGAVLTAAAVTVGAAAAAGGGATLVAWAWRSWLPAGTLATAGEVVVVAVVIVPTYLVLLRLAGRPEPADLAALARSVRRRLRPPG